MVLLKTFLITFLAVNVNLKSCNQAKKTVRSSSIKGLWTGTFTTKEGSTGLFYFSIKPDGNLMIENYYKGIQRVANGTWTLKGNSFTCVGTYFYGSPENIGTVTKHTAFFDNKTSLNAGVWKNMTPNNDRGNFTMTKVQ